jgi:hypothetical protein
MTVGAAVAGAAVAGAAVAGAAVAGAAVAGAAVAGAGAWVAGAPQAVRIMLSTMNSDKKIGTLLYIIFFSFYTNILMDLG